MQRKRLVRSTTFLLSLLLFIAGTVGAEEVILPSGSTGKINDNPIKITAAGTYIIEGNGTSTDNTITVELPSDDDEANITIKGIHIEVKGCPFNIKTGTVNLNLVGDNVLKGTRSEDAALQLSETRKLVITGEKDGKLTATGGSSSASIGGGNSGSCGNIIINGGTVTATAVSSSGVGIGCGYRGSGGTITINGGVVTTTAVSSGAGIGGGISPHISSGSVDEVTITGGIINTYNIRYITRQLSISGGTIVSENEISTELYSNASFEITGGSVCSSGICSTTDGTGLAVIKGLPKEAEVTSIRISGEDVAMKDLYTDSNGLLYLYLPSGNPVSLSLTIENKEGTSATYEAPYVVTSEVYDNKKSGANAAQLRPQDSPAKLLSRNQNGGTIEMLNSYGNVVTWNDMPGVGNTVTLKVKLKYGNFLNYDKLKGIEKGKLNVEFIDKGTDSYGNPCLVYHISFPMPDNDVFISLFDNLVVETNVTDGYEQNFKQLTIKKPGEYTLKGAFALLSEEEKAMIEWKEVKDKVIISPITIANNLSGQKDVSNEVVLHLDGVSIGSNGNALSCGENNTVRVVLDGENYLSGGGYCAALNKGPDDGTLTIEGVGRLEARGGSSVAGIGGNYGQPTKNIMIKGGTIVASGGNWSLGGIAGADGSSNIVISGGSLDGTVPNITTYPKKTEITFPATRGEKVFKFEGVDGYKDMTGMNLYPESYGSGNVKLCLWLPEKFINNPIDINGYTGTVTVGEPSTLTEEVIISDKVSYAESDHKDKSILIKDNGIFTVSANNATVCNLRIEDGGKLLTEKGLDVKGLFRVMCALPNAKWTTFCSPVALVPTDWEFTQDNISTYYKYLLKGGYSAANDQKWTLKPAMKKDTPYLLGFDSYDDPKIIKLDAYNVTLPGKTAAPTAVPGTFGNYLLFQANPSLTEQKLKNIYVLDVEKQEVVLKTDEYVLQPFEAYFVASPAVQKQFKRFSLADGSGEPTGIAEVLNGNFQISATGRGTLLLDNRGEAGEVAIYNLSGHCLLRRPAFTGQERIEGLPHGVYIVTYKRMAQKVVL